MDTPETPSPLGFILMGLWSIALSLYVQRWAIVLGLFLGIALCHWVPWLAGLDPRAPE